jgi:DnaA family protein
MQLVLPVSFRKQDSLDTFVEEENEHLIAHIQNTLRTLDDSVHASQRICVINGQEGCGKSHLLLATCEQASLHNLSHQYIDMAQIINMPTELFVGFINKDVVCIDNLALINANEDWQRAVFDTINQFTELNGRLLLIATRQVISSMDYKLPDLKTRLMWGTNFTMHSLSDEGKEKALAKHMGALGISFNADVAAFLIKRVSRSMHELVKIINTLDKASLRSKRKLTIPFVKATLKI